MATDPELRAHQQWLGYLQPVGLVVSPHALLQAEAHVNTNIIVEHQAFLAHADETRIMNLRGLLLNVFGWRAGDLIEADDPRAEALQVVLPEYHETLLPTYAVPDDLKASPPRWLMLIQELPLGTPLDEEIATSDRHWQATPQARFERLLRQTQVPIGLLCNGTQLRLVYAPHGETAGHLPFPVKAMTEVAGRPIFAALLMLLSADRLFSMKDKQRLPAILAESRKYQNTVSTKLAMQVLAALYELLRGFQAADDLRRGELLRDVLARDPDSVYAGLLTVLLRLVFLLFAEDRGLMADDELYVKHYSVTGLFERLRADAGRYPDTMDQRYGAWAQLLVLFRMVHNGTRHPRLHLPARHGYLFNPDRYPFLEGRGAGLKPANEAGQVTNVPHVADGVIFRVLNNLLILDGERISYLSLDVEQIGSVYETIMGFRLEKAAGRSIAIKPTKPHGAPVTIDLEALLNVPAKDRGKRVKEQTDQSITGAALNALKSAETPEAVVAALERKVARDLTPNIVPPAAMVLQPSDERRRSGSHYTPRSLTGPIVSKALEPVLKGLGEQPKPAQILGLKVCDPAMGSGAFLVAACRHLGDVLLKAWGVHGGMPKVPADETPELFAQRTIAQRCLYGVDKNPMAVDLAKLALWLATLAKDHAFTFLDHALRCGDSLVGLTRQQIADFHWKKAPQRVFGQEVIEQRIQSANRIRQEILEGGDWMTPLEKTGKLALADASLSQVRFAGNVAVSAFFAADNASKRQARRDELLAVMTEYLAGNMAMRPTKAERELRSGPKGITPFHWEIEFPEVFSRENPGFDCIVGNPPFLGGRNITTNFGENYSAWLLMTNVKSSGGADLVAHFFRRVYHLLRPDGTFGLIATNTIAQGDTRGTGLRWICTYGGTIYSTRRRFKWPGKAAVVVSVVHVSKGPVRGPYELDGKPVPLITAYLFHAGGHENPATLKANANRSFQGSIVLGLGFTFDDTDKDGVANSITLMHDLIAKDQRNAERIFPYIGGEEVNDTPTHAHHRYVINFGEMDESQALCWPDLMTILEEKVKPERKKKSKEIAKWPWWRFWRVREELYRSIRMLQRVLACAQTSKYRTMTFLPPCMVYDQKLIVFPLEQFHLFAILHSRVHEIWALFFGSTLEERPVYTPSDCFETFPFAEGLLARGAGIEPAVQMVDLSQLQGAGQTYYEFRAALMVRNNEGLTKTYNRFHDPNERSADIQRLRELHAAMDRAVLDAYGWTDLKPACEFLLDYVEEEDDEETGGKPRKKPWRYRWPDETRDEVLARLLELNKKRAEEEEALAGKTEKLKKPKKPKGSKSASKEQGPDLFPSTK